MYNEAYIQTFDESIYINLLNDNGKLENIAKNYLTRYEKGVDANLLALKDSLDHYIAKKISTDKNFIDSQEFKNYAKYLKKIVNQKSYTIHTNNRIYLELSTNVVFDYLTGDKLNKVFPKNNIETIRNNNQKIIRAIFQKIRENKQISSGELEFISDYLDNKKDIESETYKEYMEYIFKNNNNIIGTPKILSAILTYMPGFYDKGYACGVKNARTYLAHTDGKDKDGDDIPILIAHSSVAYNYTCFDYNYFKDMELNSYNSINSSRSFKDRDIVHLAFIAFHELTHQKQKIDAREDGNFDGAAKEINWILGKKDYHRNHDTDETEIDADERGWMKASSFVARFLGKQKELWSKCRRNAEDVRGRRAFSIKTDSKGKGKRYMDYDVSSVLEIVRNNPGILKKYPHLARIIDDYGRIKTDLLFNEEIATTNAGREFCNYIINHVPEDLLKQKIASGRYNRQQITKLLSNLVEVSHSNALALRNLKTVDFKTYSETDAKIDIEKQLENVYNYYFVECGQQMEKFESIVRFAYEKRVINKETADSYQSFFEDYYFEMLDNINNPNNDSVKGMVLNFQRSKSERIRNVAGQTIQIIQQKRIGNTHGINILQSAIDATKQHTTTGDINGIGDTIKKSTLHIDNPDIDKTE